MSKVVVTHISPDFDGIPAIWLLRRFHPDFSDAKIEFVKAGSTLNNMPPDADPNILHVDTGGGRFDHHSDNTYTCGAELVWRWIKEERGIQDPVVERMMKVIVALDHARDLTWPDAVDDRYEFSLHALISGWKNVYKGDWQKVIDQGLLSLEAVYRVMKQKLEAEKVIKAAHKFQTKWGEGLAAETGSEMILHLAEKMGYTVVVRKDPRRGNVRIYARWDKKVDLEPALHEFRKQDPDSDWFLHASHCLLLNGSNKNPGMRPTKLVLENIIKVLEKI